MPELEQRLEDLARAIDWPATPDLSTNVAGELTSPRVARVRPPRTLIPNRWVLAAAAALVIAATILAYTPTRTAIASWVNLHVLIERTQHPPTPSLRPSGPLGENLGLGRMVTLGEARASVTWPVLAPSSLGAPDAVYYDAPPDGPVLGEVSLVYASRAGIAIAGQTGVSVLVTEARGRVDQNFFGKMLGPGTSLEQVTVAGHQGFWIAGPTNVFFFIDADGGFRSETMRLAANTLIFDDNGTIVRVEGDLSKPQALAIASSLS